MLDIEPIRRRRIYEDVAERLQQLMLDGTLGEGDALPSERELMEQFKVGRPAIREALLSLQKAGLVSIANGERARVARPDPKHFIHELSASVRAYLAQPAGMAHFQNARLHLELALTRHAAREAGPADIARIGDALARNRRDLGDRAAFEASDIAFHYQIVLVAQNPLFNGLHQAVVQWLSQQRKVTLQVAEAKELALAYHERIYDGIAAHDADAAEAAMRAHLEAVETFYWERAPGGLSAAG
ncbi:GntR family transcriptional regulator [Ancylobacter polymorphus]|uniref:GntR family transcriptional regulator n=1 Tax=Ancylobacter polymorphus TaxID=223390 RepID=A0A9E7CW31_9HYPH|nr:GntR family transcriptional regulator [Ancylobacter polymorphus]UOK71948.1 GntR family transcriptional regulator [Ancylobacter polymorphus]